MKKIKSPFSIFLALQCLCLLVLLVLCFQKDKLVMQTDGASMQKSEAEGSDTYFRGESFLIKPGIYDIKVTSQVRTGPYMQFLVENESELHKSILSNILTVFNGNDEMVYSVWVWDKIPVHIQCLAKNSDENPLISAEIFRTSKIYRVLFLTLLALFAALDGLLVFRKGVLEGRISKKRQVVFWVMCAGILTAFFPLLADYCFIGADDMFHMTRIQGLAESIKAGEGFPIRVQSYWNYGHGYAVSMFYGDLFLFFPAFLVLMGFPFYVAYNTFIFVLLAGSALVAYFAFYQCIKEEYAALFGSMAYLLIPYHIFNFYNRGAMGECVAFVFLPLIFCGMYLMFTEKEEASSFRVYKWYLILGLTGLINSHVITTEMTALTMVAFCVIFWKKTFSRKRFLQLAEAACISLLLNIWFWLPLVYMMKADSYHLQTIISFDMQERGLLFSSLFQFLLNKGAAQTGMYHNEPVQLGVGVCMAYLLYLLWGREKRSGQYGPECTWLGNATAIFVILSTRYLPWNAMMKIPLLGKVISSFQFPSRWMVIATIFGAAFICFFFAKVQRDGGKKMKAAFTVAVILAVVSEVYHVNDIAFNTTPRYLYDAKNIGTISVGNGEYLLEEVGDFGLDLYYHDPVATEGLSWSDYTKVGNRITMKVKNESGQALTMELPLMGYKGYGIKVMETISGGDTSPFVSDAVGNHGDLMIVIPGGYEGTIKVYYEGFWFFRAAEAVSLISLLAVALFWIYHGGKRHGTKKAV